MPTKYKDYPIYTYDEPATYSDFSGGINTDPSNEHLLENELRDCLNMHYSSGALIKRQGASILSTIKCDDELFNIQGIFLFTHKITYLIIAADGKLYYGYYAPKGTIQLRRLHIPFSTAYTDIKYDPTDVSAGLENSSILKTNIQHDGYAITHYIDTLGKAFDVSNAIDFISLKEGEILYKDDIVFVDNNYYKVTSSKDSSYIKQIIKPTNQDYWMPLYEYNTVYKEAIAEGTDPISIYYKNSSNNKLSKLIKSSYNEWVINPSITYDIWADKSSEYNKGDCVVFDNGELTLYYICILTHTPSFTNALKTSLLQLHLTKELIFQNYLPVESATFDNKMYITTGTRFVKLELKDNNLTASVVSPYKINSSEFIHIGDNYLSPYPELCRETTYNQAITSISTVLSIEQTSGEYILQPVMTFAGNETPEDYAYKWEKFIDGVWVTVVSYKDNSFTDADNIVHKNNYYTLTVNDADKYQYRVSFAKAFEKPLDMIESWDFKHGQYEEGDTVSVLVFDGTDTVTKAYKCLVAHDPAKIVWPDVEYDTTQTKAPESGKSLDSDSDTLYFRYIKQIKQDEDKAYVIKNDKMPAFNSRSSMMYTTWDVYMPDDSTKESKTYTSDFNKQQPISLWQLITSEEEILRYNTSTNETEKDTDLIVDKVTGEYFGQATSVIAKDLSIDSSFTSIHSCRKITSDGNKMLLYGDKFNSGSWFKTIINNPHYITLRGGLSFKTNKNETLLKVIPFQGNLIAFANSENVGGSIHLITGNGDDYDTNDGYYSPYRRNTINNSISCDNENTIQVCENILVFKYFDTLYYITASELSNEVITLYSCNDRIKHNNNFVRIPWEDNSCISEVTDDYYALIWKEKYSIQNGDLVLERPALKIKMYYKLNYNINNKYLFPWLRDESTYFNIDHILYIQGKPVYLYNNTLLSFHSNEFTDIGSNYTCLIHFRGEELNYPKILKLINSVLVYYHRNQYSNINFNLKVCNEAGHELITNNSNKISLQDIRALKTGTVINKDTIRLDSTILDSKVFNAQYMFPCLLADTIITADTDKEFSISSITYTYTTSEVPETTPYDLYSNIIRMREVK